MALPLPLLRVTVVQGCVGVPEVQLDCHVTGTLASASPQSAGSDDALLSSVAAVAEAAGPPLRLKSITAQPLRAVQLGSCIPVDVTFKVVPHRRWPRSPLSTGGGALIDVCSGSVTLFNRSVSVPAAAATAYLHPATSAQGVRCELRPAPTVSDASSSSRPLLAVANAVVLAAEPALAAITGIFVYRRTTDTLLSLAMDAPESVRSEDALVLLRSNSVEGAASKLLLARLLTAISSHDTILSAADGAPFLIGNATALALHHAIAAAAHRAAGLRASPARQFSSAAATSVAGRTIMALQLDTSSTLRWPSLLHAEQATQLYRAAESELQQLIDAAAPAPTTGLNHLPFTLEEAPVDFSCSSASWESTRAWLAKVSAPRQRLAVSIGGIRARVLWVSPDGSQVHVETPSLAELCGNSTADASAPASVSASATCGYKTIAVFYEPEENSAAANVTQGADVAPIVSLLRRLTSPSQQMSGFAAWIREWLQQGRGLLSDSSGTSALNALLETAALSPLTRSVSCPPWCPAQVDADAVPLALAVASASAASLPVQSAWFGGLVPASFSSDSDALPLPLPGWATSDGLADISGGIYAQAVGGLYYTQDCAGAGFLSVESGVCSNISDPEHRRCAFLSSRGECVACPANSYCPGGARAVPYPGFYTGAEASGLIRPCAAPAEERCIGWDSSLGVVRCGEAYKPLSPGCIACADGWYPRDDGRCRRCPVNASGVSALLRAVGLIIGAALSMGLCILLLTYLLAKGLGGTIQGGFWRAADLLLWSVLLLQVLGQVGRSAAPGLPLLIQGMFRALAALQLEEVGLPSACWRLYPFTAEVLQCGGVVALTLLMWIVQLRESRRCCSQRRGCSALLHSWRPRRKVPRGSDPRMSARLCIGWPSCFRRADAPLSRSAAVTTTHASATVASRRSRLSSAVITAAASLYRSTCTCEAISGITVILCCITLTLLYSLLANTVFKLLHCKTETLSLTGYAVLDRDNSAVVMADLLARAAIDASLRSKQFTVSLMASNPAYMCYSGAHRPAAIMAWLALVLYMVGYPVSTVMMLRSRAMHLLQRTFGGFPSVGCGPVPECLLLGFHDASSRAAASAMISASQAAGSDDRASAVCASDKSFRAIIDLDGGARRALLARSPCLGRIAWLICGAERTLRAFAFASESAGMRAARNVQLRKLTAQLRASNDSVQTAARIRTGDALRSTTTSAAAQKLTARVTTSIFSDEGAAASMPSAPDRQLREAMTVQAASDADTTSAWPTPSEGAPEHTLTPSADKKRSPGSRDKGSERGAVVLPPPLFAGNLVASALDGSRAVEEDSWMLHWTGATFRGSAYTARHLDFAVVAALAALQVFWPRPVSGPEVAVRACLNVALLLSAAAWVVTRSPFKRDEPWKHAIKVGSLLLCALAAVLTHVTLATDLVAAGDASAGINVGADAADAEQSQPAQAPADRALQQQLSIAVFTGCVLLVLALAWTFAASSISGARLELRARQNRVYSIPSTRVRWSLMLAASGASNRGPGRSSGQRDGGTSYAVGDGGFTGSRLSPIDNTNSSVRGAAASVINPLRERAAQRQSCAPTALGQLAVPPSPTDGTAPSNARLTFRTEDGLAVVATRPATLAVTRTSVAVLQFPSDAPAVATPDGLQAADGQDRDAANNMSPFTGKARMSAALLAAPVSRAEVREDRARDSLRPTAVGHRNPAVRHKGSPGPAITGSHL